MTLDEAIEHAEEKACGNGQCAKDHAQLADWLNELKLLEAENAKLRELVIEQRKLAQMRLAGAIIECLWPGEAFDQYDALMMATAKVNRLSKELRIEVD